jgi:hypothetical protein
VAVWGQFCSLRRETGDARLLLPAITAIAAINGCEKEARVGKAWKAR